ncbi:hypothetical protein H5410_008610 [Solanum commersonii]|uniref:Uncharacterized protein n=1 Tax=Solanum commersonii TaxID=4109 RepID=A0A9J6AFN1_SOLCO|nr:hypothetical protein H5410_008610 [Solanum commersonii]
MEENTSTLNENGKEQVNANAVAELDTSSPSLTLPTNSSSPAPVSSTTAPLFRRSTRTTFGQAPSHLKDYICNSIVLTDVLYITPYFARWVSLGSILRGCWNYKWCAVNETFDAQDTPSKERKRRTNKVFMFGLGFIEEN